MQTSHRRNQSSKTAGTRGGEKEVLGPTSRKTRGAGAQVCTEPLEGVQRGPALTSGSLHTRCGPGVRKWRQAPSETAGSGRKSRPTSRLPCSSAAGALAGVQPPDTCACRSRAAGGGGAQPPPLSPSRGGTSPAGPPPFRNAPQHRPIGNVPCTSKARAVTAA